MFQPIMFLRAAFPGLAYGTLAAGATVTALGLVTPAVGCSAAQQQTVKTVDNTAIDLTNAICTVAADTPIGAPYTEIVCAIAQGVEQTINVTLGSIGDGGVTTAVMSVPVEQIRLKIPTPSVAGFLAAHKGH